MPTSNFCIMPFINFTTTPNGEVRTCCKNYEVMGDTTRNSIINIWNSEEFKNRRVMFLNNERPASCYECWNIEDSPGGISLREIDNQKYGHLMPEILEDVKQDGTMPLKIRTTELLFSNLCNLSCRMCFPKVSTSVANVWRKYQIQKIAFFEDAGYKSSFDDITSALNDLKQIAPYLEEIVFSGGEPLLDENFAHVIAILEDYKKNIKLKIVTNLSNLAFANFNFSGFKSLEVVVSMEGGPILHNYIRVGSDYNDIVVNVKTLRERYPDIKITVNMVVQIYSMLGFAFGIRQIFKSIKPDNLTCSYGSHYLHGNLLPEDLKTLAQQRMDTLIEDIDVLKTTEENKILVIKLLKSAINYMNSPFVNQWDADMGKEQTLRQFIQFANKLDFANNTRILDVIPEFKSFWVL